LVPFEKNFYIPHKNVEGMKKKAVDKFRVEKEISIVKGDKIPNPITSFEEANIPDYLMRSIKLQEYKEPSPIQSQGWPIALSGHDLVRPILITVLVLF